ncbi:unnamed protein product [Lampetra fluviatilis]
MDRGGGAVGAPDHPARRHPGSVLNHPTHRQSDAAASLHPDGGYLRPAIKCSTEVRHAEMGETETPLAFRSALMSLAQVAYSKMEHARLDSLVLERTLTLADELNIFLPITGEDDLSSLKRGCARGAVFESSPGSLGRPHPPCLGARRQTIDRTLGRHGGRQETFGWGDEMWDGEEGALRERHHEQSPAARTLKWWPAGVGAGRRPGKEAM